MDSLNTVFWILMSISTVALVAFAGTLATWEWQFFSANRPVRIARHESITSYYGHRLAH